MDNIKHAYMMMIVITEEREEKKSGIGPIKKISWPTNTKKNYNVLYASIKKDEVCT